MLWKGGEIIIKKLYLIVISLALFLISAQPAFAYSINISGNGARSRNRVRINSTNRTKVTQKNRAFLSNTVTAESETGDIKANSNTDGGVSITTGNALITVKIKNTLNFNWASVDTCCDAEIPPCDGEPVCEL